MSTPQAVDARSILGRFAYNLLVLAAAYCVGGLYVMVAVNIVHDYWIPQVPTIGYWTAVALNVLLRGTFSTVTLRRRT